MKALNAVLLVITLLVSTCFSALQPGTVTLLPSVRGSALIGSGSNRLYSIYASEYSFILDLPDYDAGSVAFIPAVGIDQVSGTPNILYQVIWNNKPISTGSFTINTAPFVFDNACMLVNPGDNVTVDVQAASGKFSATVSVWYTWIEYNITSMKCVSLQ